MSEKKDPGQSWGFYMVEENKKPNIVASEHMQLSMLGLIIFQKLSLPTGMAI